MYLRTCENFNVLTPQIANSQSVTLSGRSANLENYFSPQICRFATLRNLLRTVHQ